MNSEERSLPRMFASGLLAAGLVFLFAGERIVGEGSMRWALSGLGALAVLGALVLRTMRLVSAEGDVKRIEKRLFLTTLGVLVALGLYVVSTDGVIAFLAMKRTAADRTSGVLSALWPAVLVVSALGLFFMESAYARMPLARAVEFRRVRVAGQGGLTLGLSLVFLMSANYVVTKRDSKRDFSYFKTTRPSETSRGMVKKLSEKVRVILFYPEVNEVLSQVRPFFNDLAGSSKLKIEVRDHALSPEMARDYRIRANGFVLMLRGDDKDDKSKAQGESFEIGTELEESRAKLKKLDATFQEHFSKLTQPPRAVSFTTGHDEHSTTGREGDDVGARVSGVKELLRRFNVSSSDLGIAQGLASKVPDDARAVAIMGPRKPFLPEEAEALLSFVRNGGRLLVSVDPDIDLGLDALFSGLGLERLPGVVASQKNHMRRHNTDADRVIVFSNTYTSHPAVTTASKNAREVASIFIGAAGFAAKVVPGVTPAPKVTFPLTSSDDVWRDLNANYTKDEGEPTGRTNLIAAVTVGDSSKEGRVVVIGDGDFATDQVLQNPGNLTVFVDSLRWLIGEEQITGGLATEEDVAIEHTRDKDKLWFYATTFGVPVPVLLLGLWVSKRRRQRASVERKP